MKHFVRALALASACALLPGGMAHAQSAEPFKIGVSNDQSGPYADQGGPGSAVAARMAAEDFGGEVLGRQIEIVIADNQNKPDIASQIARRWFDVDGVSTIVDGGSSASGLAAQGVATERNKVFLDTAGTAPNFVGDQCSPYGTQWASSSYSLANTVVQQIVSEGGKKWFFLTTDFVFGHALEGVASEAIKAAGGEILGSAKHPINTQDFSSYIFQAQASGADVIAIAAGGSDLVRAVQQVKEFQVPGQLVALYVSQPEIESMGLNVAQGLRFATPFAPDVSDRTKAWTERFLERHGKMPSMIHANTYTAVSHYLHAVEQAGSDKGEDVIEFMKSLPFGDYSLIANPSIKANGRVFMDMYVAEVKSPAESQYDGDVIKVVATLPADEVYEDITLSGCPLLQN